MNSNSEGQDLGFRLASIPNRAPVDVSLSSTTVPENQPSGTAVGTLSATDPDIGDRFSYSLVSGTNNLSLAGSDAASFEIDGLALYLKAGTVLNHEAKTAYAVTVIAQDATVSGSSILTVNYALAITNVPEALTAPRVSAPAFFTVVEDTPTALVFSSPPFSDSESPVTKAMTVTIGVVAGTLAATSAEGVTRISIA